MSVLIALIPAQAQAAEGALRTAAVAGAESGSPARSADGLTQAGSGWAWVLSDNGQQIVQQGEDPPALWPRAQTLVLVVPPDALAWVPTELPKVAAGRLKSALAGALEEALLEDPEQLHFALPPEARPGRPLSVAVMSRGRLWRALQAVQAAGRQVDRVVPAFAPSSSPRGHFLQTQGQGAGQCQLVWTDAGGTALLPLLGDGARALVQATQEAQAQRVEWSATPAAAAAAQAWLGQPVAVVAEAQPWLDAAASGWELRQFDMAPRHRGLQWAREAWRRFTGPDWRPARLGLAAVVVLNIVGLQAWAWQLQQAVQARKQAQVALLQSTHPQARVVLDAPLQMQRELERLREAAGVPGEADLEAALSALASAWPVGLGQPQALRYERGQLSVSLPGAAPTQTDQLGRNLQALGWALEVAGSRLTLTWRPPATAGGVGR